MTDRNSGFLSTNSPSNAGSEPGIPAQSNPQVETALSTHKHSTTHADSTFPKALKPSQNGVQVHPHPPNPTSHSKVMSNGTKNATDASSQKGNLKRSSLDNDSAPPAKKSKVSDSVPAYKAPVPGGPMANGQGAKRPLADESPSSATKKAKLTNGVQSKAEASNHVLPSSQENISSQDSRKKENSLKNKPPTSLESSAKKAPASKLGGLEQSKPAPASASKPALPPLLSPTLPPQVIAANSSIEPVNLKPSGKATNSSASKSPNPGSSKTINSAPSKSLKPVLGKPGMSKTGVETRSRTLLPSLLSPGLPPEVEAALEARKKGKEVEKNALSNEKHVTAPRKPLDTVAERHEKSRQPNAPGTARKVVRNGKNGEEANSSTTDLTGSGSVLAQDSLVIKLSYKKRRVKDVERILKLRPNRAAEVPNKNGLEENSTSKAGDQPSSRDERRNSLDRSRLNNRPAASKLPASSSMAQKRPRAEESTPVHSKRLKPSEQPQSSKASTPMTPAIKASTTSAPSSAQKTVTNTPKKGDSLKSAAMMRVSSTDGPARTPQATRPSLPGSAEKPSVLHGTTTNNDLRESANLTVQELANLSMKLKREFDRLHQTKAGGLSSISSADRQLGLVVGLECILTFLTQFDALDTTGKGNYGNWEGILKLHGWFDQVIQDIPIMEVLSLQIKIICRFKLANAFASNSFNGINPQRAAENTIQQAKLWKELDHKMSNEHVQTAEEATSRSRKGFNPGGSTQHFIATSLRKLKRYANSETIPWEQQLKISD